MEMRLNAAFFDSIDPKRSSAEPKFRSATPKAATLFLRRCPGAPLLADELLRAAVQCARRSARDAIAGYVWSNLPKIWSNLPKRCRRHDDRPRGQAAVLATHGGNVTAVGARCGVGPRDQRSQCERCRRGLNLRNADRRCQAAKQKRYPKMQKAFHRLSAMSGSAFCRRLRSANNGLCPCGEHAH
jgi:hypothetical protein